MNPMDDDTTPAEANEQEAETFTAEYVKQLRDESAGYRTRARDAENRAEHLAQRLYAELVRATGKLADPTDLPFDAEALDDAEKLTGAIDGLIAAKPHLKARKPTGDVGMGDRGKESGPRDFSALFR